MADCCDQSNKIKVRPLLGIYYCQLQSSEYEFSCGQSGSLHRAPQTNYAHLTEATEAVKS